MGRRPRRHVWYVAVPIRGASEYEIIDVSFNLVGNDSRLVGNDDRLVGNDEISFVPISLRSSINLQCVMVSDF